MLNRIKIVRAETLRESIPAIDLHVHTLLSDGQNTIKEYIKRAQRLGLKQIAFSDHMRKESTWFNAFLKEFEQARGESGNLEIFKSAEAKLTPNDDLDIGKEVLNKIDFVIGVIHSYPKRGGYFKFDELNKEKALNIDIEASVRLIECKDVDVVGHLGGVYHKYFGPYPSSKYKELIKIIKEKNKILEINPRYISDMKKFLDICFDINPHITIGSDAHSINELGNARVAIQEALWKK